MVKGYSAGKLNEKENKISAHNFELLFEHSKDAIFIHDLKGKILDVNKIACLKFGYSKKEFLNNSIKILHIKSFNPKIISTIPIIQKKKKFICKATYLSKKGIAYNVELFCSLISYRNKNAVLSIARDVTALRKMESSLLESKLKLEKLVSDKSKEVSHYKDLFEKIPIGLYRTTPRGEILEVNQAFIDILKFPNKELLLKNNIGIIYNNIEEREKWKDILEEKEKVINYKTRIKCYDNSIIWVLGNSRIVKDGKGTILYYEGSIEDITEQESANEELHLSQRIIRAASEENDFSNSYKISLRLICEFTKWDYGEVWLPWKANSDLTLSSIWCANSLELHEFRNQSLQVKRKHASGLPQKVLYQKKAIWYTDITKEKSFVRKNIAKRFGIKLGIGIPITSDNQIVAVLIFFSKIYKENDLYLINLISCIASQLGTVFLRKKAEEDLSKNLESQKVLNQLLILSLQDISLDNQLEQALNILLSVPWLHTLPKGGIFLVDDKTNELVLRVQKDLPDGVLFCCKRIKKGFCLCGRAYETGKIQFADHVDKRHDLRYDGIRDHGHYNIPIKYNDKVIGVIVLYLNPKHEKKVEEVIFLEAVASTLSGLITRKLVENTLREERNLFISGKTVIFRWRIGEGWPVDYVSVNVQSQFGYDPNDFTSGKVKYKSIIHPDDIARIEQEVQEFKQKDVPYFEQEYRIFTASGEIKLVYDFTVIVKNEVGQIDYFHGYILDITEREVANKQIKKLSNVVEQTGDMVMISNNDGYIEYVNPSFEKFTGYTYEELINKKTSILKSGFHDYEFYNTLWKTVLRGDVFQAEFVNKKKNGEIYYESKTITPIKDKHGVIINFVSIGRDITSRMKKVHELEKSEEKYRGLFEEDLSGVVLTDTPGNIIDCNKAFLKIFGYSDLKEIAGLNLMPKYLKESEIKWFLKFLKRIPALLLPN